MIALRQLKRVPKNHKIVIEVPCSIHENQMMEVILLFLAMILSALIVRTPVLYALE